MSRWMIALMLFFVVLSGADVQQPPKKPGEPTATPPDKIKVLKDFRVELLYSVPKGKQGSWVSLCVDPKGRLIVSDQAGWLYRVTPPPLTPNPSPLSTGERGETKVETIPAKIGGAQGLLWAFDSLYVMVNSNKWSSGLYRVRSSKNDDVLDDVKQLRKLTASGNDHGPHAILAAPDGKSLFVVCGNQTPLTTFDRSRVPQVWGEDHLLPRMPDVRGFMVGVLGPGGAIYKVDPDGKDWELFSVGYRNPYDAAFNRYGDLITYDADMEWDMNTPWYRPTRLCLATSGSEFGWRNGTGKWPPHYADSLPALYDVGPGSPTGMTFGYGAKFPAKYQEALFGCDWSYGKLYAFHLTPEGSAYKVQAEEFLAGTPLPMTDIVVNPKDGALYFVIGGRSTQSGLYRVTYTGKESTAPAKAAAWPNHDRERRLQMEALHGQKDLKTVETTWPQLDSSDRYIRYAARVAIEHQDVTSWRERALAEKRPTASINALLALVRVSASDPQHHPRAAPPDAKLRGQIVEALERLDWTKLDDGQRLELLRVYQVLFNRFGKPSEAERKTVIAKLDLHYPAKDRLLNADLCQVLVYLEAPNTAVKTMKLLAAAPTQEEQLEYVKSLRVLKTGWTPELRKDYFSWFLKGGTFRGGASFDGFVRNIKADAVKGLTEDEKTALKTILEPKPSEATVVIKPRPLVKKYTVADLTLIVEKGLKNRDFDRGRTLFGQAVCFSCHRFNNEGGAVGPDLTAAVGRFNVRDLLESIIEPSKEISDQYAAVIITTTDGKTVTGRVVNLHGDTMHVMTDMLNPGKLTNVDRKKVESMKPSKVSLMPEGLLDTLKEEEILDLIAFLLSRGDRKNAMFK